MGDTFAVTGNLIIYSNQYSNSLCLKSCKVCLNGAVRTFHLAALGLHPCCKGQLSNAWTIREIMKWTQLEPGLGSLPELQGLCSRCWPGLQWHCCDRTVGPQGQGGGGAGGTGCPVGRHPKKVPQTLPAAWGEELDRGSSMGCTQHRALKAGFWSLVSCYPTALSLNRW